MNTLNNSIVLVIFACSYARVVLQVLEEAHVAGSIGDSPSGTKTSKIPNPVKLALDPFIYGSGVNICGLESLNSAGIIIVKRMRFFTSYHPLRH
jgi:hypothetical protein